MNTTRMQNVNSNILYIVKIIIAANINI